jgi:hypothetical protein
MWFNCEYTETMLCRPSYSFYWFVYSSHPGLYLRSAYSSVVGYFETSADLYTLHGVTSHKTTFFIVTAVITRYLNLLKGRPMDSTRRNAKCTKPGPCLCEASICHSLMHTQCTCTLFKGLIDNLCDMTGRYRKLAAHTSLKKNLCFIWPMGGGSKPTVLREL